MCVRSCLPFFFLRILELLSAPEWMIRLFRSATWTLVTLLAQKVGRTSEMIFEISKPHKSHRTWDL